MSIGVAGFYGSYQVERAERDRALREIEESTLSSLHDTTLYSASRYATVLVAPSTVSRHSSPHCSS